jgi:hypothetical protein
MFREAAVVQIRGHTGWLLYRGSHGLTSVVMCCTHFGHESGVIQDRGQQVVEVVGDPARELAQALQQLGLMQPVPGPYLPRTCAKVRIGVA